MQTLRYRLYLGHNIKNVDGTESHVDTELAADLVAVAFPNGFTMLSATGRWRSSGGQTIAEQSTVFEILAPESDADKVRETARALASMFRQDAVMLTAEPVPQWDFIGQEIKA